MLRLLPESLQEGQKKAHLRVEKMRKMFERNRPYKVRTIHINVPDVNVFVVESRRHGDERRSY